MSARTELQVHVYLNVQVNPPLSPSTHTSETSAWTELRIHLYECQDGLRIHLYECQVELKIYFYKCQVELRIHLYECQVEHTTIRGQ